MLFQKTIIKKYLGLLKEEAVSEAWNKFQAYFLDAQIQANIKQSKEEQFQEGFLRELFVNVLGYTLNPSPNYNLVTEKKNETNSKKADGAILLDGKVIGVIELKDHKTTDLSKVEPQAFNYKSQHPDARYVLISNFEKLRLYIDNAVEYHEWSLFNLNEEGFRELYLCLAWMQVEQGMALQMKQESVSSEDQITKALYRDYSQFKRVLFADILEQNPTPEGKDEKDWQLLLFKKTQKLLDRLLFIFFAEDCGLLPPNSMAQIIDQWESLKEMDEYRPFYDRMKKYFGYMNTGFKGKKYEIFAYNGGLFKPDEVLDNIIISDDLLVTHTRKLSTYDFESDVDVNILGHIFENSLSEIEEVTQQINSGEALQTSKRKQDGVFYTPQYITKYIVENTVGRLCSEKKHELGIVEEEYFSDQRRQMQTKKRLLDQLQQYRDWLLQITILDPACGSGAFLNAALQWLMAEHKLIDEMEAKVAGSAIVFQDVENSILEHNLYGVDINEESVEIAQLALWLRTAKPHRKLNSLNENIKCGNSLISDPAIAGDRSAQRDAFSSEASMKKAFNWQEQFPKVFEKGGFDVVIGNPPYVHLENIIETSNKLEKAGYSTYNKRGDLYCLFVEKAFQLANSNGLVSYIMPNKWLQAGYGKELRAFFLTKRLERLIDFGDIQIFEGATTYPCIFIGRNEEPAKQMIVSVLKAADALDFNQNVKNTEEVFDISQFSSDTWVISSQKEKTLLERLSAAHQPLKKFIDGEAYRGVLTGLSEAFLIDSNTYQSIVSKDEKAKERIYPFLQGRNITPYGKAEAASYLILFEKGWTQRERFFENEVDAWDYLKTEYPSISEWLEPFADKGRKRTDKGDFWWELRACDYYEQFAKPKIMYQAFQVKPCFIYDTQGFYSNNSMWFIPTDCKALLAILNSRMGWWLITKFCTQIQNGYQLIWKYFGQIPIPACKDDKALSVLADTMLSLNSQLQEKRTRFLRRLSENFEGIKITTALQTFDLLDFKGFVAELKKQKIKLTLVQQDEWEDYFNQYRQACQELSEQIKATDNEIDSKVFDLYDLTSEERNIVLNAD